MNNRGEDVCGVCYFNPCRQLSSLTRWTFVGKVMSLLFNMLFRLLVACTGGSDDKASACNVGDLDSIPGLGRSPGEGNGNPLQYSCLENSMDGGAWWATVHGIAKSRIRLSDFTSLLQLSSKEQVSFNFMAAITICSDFGAQKNKACHCLHCFPIYLLWSDGTRCHDLSFLNVEL